MVDEIGGLGYLWFLFPSGLYGYRIPAQIWLIWGVSHPVVRGKMVHAQLLVGLVVMAWYVVSGVCRAWLPPYE